MNALALLSRILQSIQLGKPSCFRRMRLVPIHLSDERRLGYLTLEEPDAHALVEIEEVSSAGSVPDMRIRNRADRPLFIPDGTTLRGYRQDRVLNLSVMVGPRSECVVSVSCVEKGRWSEFSRPGWSLDHSDIDLRKILKCGSNVAARQHTVWRHVDGLIGLSGAFSATGSYHSVHERWAEQIGVYQRHLRCPEGAAGVILQIDGANEALDLFDHPATMRELWKHLSRGYALSVLQTADLPASAKVRRQDDSQYWLKSALADMNAETREVFGAGKTYALSGADVVGSACLWDDHLVHLSLFSSRRRI